MDKSQSATHEESHYQKTRAFFDSMAHEAAGDYDAPWSLSVLAQKRVRKIAMKLLAEEDNWNTIFDAGCGKGDFSAHLARVYPTAQITGGDFSEKMVELAISLWKEQDNPLTPFIKGDNLQFIQCDLRALPFDEHQFDITFCLNVLHHFLKFNLSHVIEEICNVTKRTVIAEIKNRDSVIKKIQEQIDCYKVPSYNPDFKEIKADFEKAGFYLVKKVPALLVNSLSPMIVAKFSRPDH